MSSSDLILVLKMTTRIINATEKDAGSYIANSHGLLILCELNGNEEETKCVGDIKVMPNKPPGLVFKYNKNAEGENIFKHEDGDVYIVDHVIGIILEMVFKNSIDDALGYKKCQFVVYDSNKDTFVEFVIGSKIEVAIEKTGWLPYGGHYDDEDEDDDEK